MKTGTAGAPLDRWLLFIHHIPPKPNYLRVKIGRRLQRIGAVALKNSVYVLPRTDEAQEDFHWVAAEIVEGGGEATVCEARFVEGMTDGAVEALFQAARSADYAALAEEARGLRATLPRRGELGEAPRAALEAKLPRLLRRLEEVAAIDFFGARGREATEGQLRALQARLVPAPGLAPLEPSIEAPRGRTWVTRKGIHVDRMASAWLIRRFIDREARFRFVGPSGYRHVPGQLRFDMFDAEFTHEGDRCTFEVLLARFGLTDPALGAIGQIVHDLDLKDGKFGREDAVGFERLVTGIALAHREDETRVERAAAVLDDLYAYYRHRRPMRGGRA